MQTVKRAIGEEMEPRKIEYTFKNFDGERKVSNGMTVWRNRVNEKLHRLEDTCSSSEKKKPEWGRLKKKNKGLRKWRWMRLKKQMESSELDAQIWACFTERSSWRQDDRRVIIDSDCKRGWAEE